MAALGNLGLLALLGCLVLNPEVGFVAMLLAVFPVANLIALVFRGESTPGKRRYVKVVRILNLCLVGAALVFVRADAVGRTSDLVSYGSSGIVGRSGTVLGAAQRLETGLVVADIKTAPRKPRPGWDASRNPAVASEYAPLVARAFAITEHSTDVTISANIALQPTTAGTPPRLRS
jgi:hypothetical protein